MQSQLAAREMISQNVFQVPMLDVILERKKKRNLVIKNYVFIESDTLYHIVCKLYFGNVEKNLKDRFSCS